MRSPGSVMLADTDWGSDTRAGGGPRRRRRCRGPSPRGASRSRPSAVAPDGAGVGRLDTEQRLGHLRAPEPTSRRSRVPRLAHLEADVGEPAPAGGPSTASATSPGSCGTRRKKSDSSRPTMSRISETSVTSADGLGRDVLAVAQHRDAVAELEHLVEAVADEQDRHARRGEAPHLAEQAPDLVGRQRGRRLVHDQHPDVTGHRLGDLDGLLTGDRELGCHRPRIDVDLEVARISPARACMSRQWTRPPPGLAHEDVLGHREVREHQRLLVDAGDAEGLGIGRGAQFDGLAVALRGSRVRPVEPGHDLDQRRLSK